MKKTILCGVVIFAVGCGEGFQNTSDLNVLSDVSEGVKTGISDKPYCEVDTVDYELDTHVLAFEITDKNNIGFGFDIVKGIFTALSMSLDTQRGKMMAAMHLRETLRPDESVVDVTGVGESMSNEFKIHLDAVKLGVDLGYFRQTPLYKLTEKTMAGTLKKLRKDLDSVETGWSSRVVHIYAAVSQMVIPAGSVAGIREGDRFEVYNMNYTWAGEPCHSKMYKRPTTTYPLAILEVTHLEKNSSLLTIVERPTDHNIEEGAVVLVNSLPLAKKEKVRPPLARSVRLTSFQSEPLSVTNGSKIDLTPYLSEQTSALLSKYGFYPRK